MIENKPYATYPVDQYTTIFCLSLLHVYVFNIICVYIPQCYVIYGYLKILYHIVIVYSCLKMCEMHALNYSYHVCCKREFSILPMRFF